MNVVVNSETLGHPSFRKHHVEDEVRNCPYAGIEKAESAFVSVEVCDEDGIVWDGCVVINVKDCAEESIDEAVYTRGEVSIPVEPVVIVVDVEWVIVHYI